MNDQYRRLAVVVDHPAGRLPVGVIESTEDPAVWLDLETGDGSYEPWIEADDAGHAALMAYVDDEPVGR